MKRLTALIALFVLTLSLLATAQSAQGNGGVRAKKVSISGRISDDGKAIIAEGKTWLVSNVEKLRDHSGESATIKGLMNPITNQIEVLSVKLTRAEATGTARLGDSAFRR